MQRLDSLYILGFRDGIRAVSKNTAQLVRLLHEYAVELADGERPELWISTDGKLFFKKEKG